MPVGTAPVEAVPADPDEPSVPRHRGRPRVEISLQHVAEAVGALFVEGGYEAVSISSTAARLNVSRATLYRTVPTKEHLLGILFERSEEHLTEVVQSTLHAIDDPACALTELIRIQVDAAIRMRDYLPIFFDGSGVPPDVFIRWRTWSRRYEALWVQTVERAMDAGSISRDDPRLTARLLLGMCVWVSRWYRSSDSYTADEIAAAVVQLHGTGRSIDATPA